jgi:hypothetical protein
MPESRPMIIKNGSFKELSHLSEVFDCLEDRVELSERDSDNFKEYSTIQRHAFRIVLDESFPFPQNSW